MMVLAHESWSCWRSMIVVNSRIVSTMMVVRSLMMIVPRIVVLVARIMMPRRRFVVVVSVTITTIIIIVYLSRIVSLPRFRLVGSLIHVMLLVARIMMVMTVSGFLIMSRVVVVLP